MTSYAEDSDELAGGQWVRTGLLWHWKPDPILELVPEIDERPDYNPHDLIACTYCLARMDERCKTGDGRSHESRLVKPVCSCGGPIRPGEPMCGFCRAEMARAA